MKRFITLSTLLFLVCMAINAQVQLTIETTAGGLKDAMTEEQRQTVTDLTLTGSMNDADFCLIRDNMPILKKLDIKSIIIDTIPVKALYKSNKFSNIVLPRSLKYIGDSAFVRVNGSDKIKIVFTGKFPKIGRFVFNEEDYDKALNQYSLEISEDNEYCMKYENGIYSNDGKIFFQGCFGKDPIYELKEGLECIAPRAFFGGYFIRINIPSSLKSIGDEAFANICTTPIPMTANDFFYQDILCKCITPPELGKSVFSSDMGFEPIYFRSHLYVEKEAIGLYQSTSQWKQFTIRDINEFQGGGNEIHTEKRSTLVINNHFGLLEIRDSRIINQAELINLQGNIIQCKYPVNSQVSFAIQNIDSSIAILRIIYSDGKIKTIKQNL